MVVIVLVLRFHGASSPTIGTQHRRASPEKAYCCFWGMESAAGGPWQNWYIPESTAGVFRRPGSWRPSHGYQWRCRRHHPKQKQQCCGSWERVQQQQKQQHQQRHQQEQQQCQHKQRSTQIKNYNSAISSLGKFVWFCLLYESLLLEVIRLYIHRRNMAWNTPCFNLFLSVSSYMSYMSVSLLFYILFLPTHLSFNLS